MSDGDGIRSPRTKVELQALIDRLDTDGGMSDEVFEINCEIGEAASRFERDATRVALISKCDLLTAVYLIALTVCYRQCQDEDDPMQFIHHPAEYS